MYWCCGLGNAYMKKITIEKKIYYAHNANYCILVLRQFKHIQHIHNKASGFFSCSPFLHHLKEAIMITLNTAEISTPPSAFCFVHLWKTHITPAHTYTHPHTHAHTHNGYITCCNLQYIYIWTLQKYRKESKFLALRYWALTLWVLIPTCKHCRTHSSDTHGYDIRAIITIISYAHCKEIDSYTYHKMEGFITCW